MLSYHCYVTPTKSPLAAAGRLMRIQEAAAEVGLTPRSVRYYEELGLLRPAARSEGDYRLYDDTDVERLRFIKGLRDDAGFSLAEIARLLEDEEARERGHQAYHATADPIERMRILRDRLLRYDQQIAMLQTKIGRLQGMVDEARARRSRTAARIDELASADRTPAGGGQPEAEREMTAGNGEPAGAGAPGGSSEPEAERKVTAGKR
jgi:MerR family transcriptional regulator, repressor of the yfmOP operon